MNRPTAERIKEIRGGWKNPPPPNDPSVDSIVYDLIAEVDALRADLQRVEAERDRFTKALEEIANRSNAVDPIDDEPRRLAREALAEARESLAERKGS